MTSGMLFALAIGTLVVFVLVGLMRRSRSASQAERSASDPQNTVAQWTEGETTRLLSSAEWDSAATTPGVQLSDNLFEWVESPGDPRNAKQVRRRGASASKASRPVLSMERPDTGYKDVTFRMAKDISGL